MRTKEASEKLAKLIQDKISTGEIEVVEHEVNEKGEWLIDKDEHPQLYDWAANG